MNFWLTVLTGIFDPLVFGFHSSHEVMCVLIHWRSMGSTLADKVLRKTPLDLQKRFPKHHVCHKYLAAHFCGLAFPENGLAFLQDFDEVGKTLVDWERGIVHCVLIQHLENLSNHHTIDSVCNSCIFPVSSRTVSRSSTNFLLEIVSNVDP